MRNILLGAVGTLVLLALLTLTCLHFGIVPVNADAAPSSLERWAARTAPMTPGETVLELSARPDGSAANLSITPDPTPKQTFTAGILQVERYGNPSGPQLIFIPALFCGAWEWNAQIAALAPRYDLFVVTLPGLAGRPMVGGHDLMRRAVDSLHQLVLTHHLRPIVVGHSLGGTLGVLYAQTYPHDLRALISVEGGYPIAPTLEQREQRVDEAIKPFEGISRRALAPVLRKFQLQYLITSPATVDAVLQRAARSDPQAIVAWMRAALLLDLTPGLSKITVPFLEIVPYDRGIDGYRGYATEGAKRAAYTAWIARAPHGRVVMIASSRHFVMYDQPTVFERTLEQAVLGSLTRSTRLVQ